MTVQPARAALHTSKSEFSTHGGGHRRGRSAASVHRAHRAPRKEKKEIADDVRDVYAEAKANGYDPKIMRMVVRLRKMETHTRQEQDAILETYRAALGLA